MDKKDLNEISVVIKTEINSLRTEMNQKFEEQDERIDKKFEEQNKKIDLKFEEQNKKMEKKFRKQDEIIQQKYKEISDKVTKEISNQMLIFEEHYGKSLTIAVEGLNHKNSKIDVQNQRLDNLENANNLNTAYVYDHEKRIHNLEKTLNKISK